MRTKMLLLKSEMKRCCLRMLHRPSSHVIASLVQRLRARKVPALSSWTMAYKILH